MEPASCAGDRDVSAEMARGVVAVDGLQQVRAELRVGRHRQGAVQAVQEPPPELKSGGGSAGGRVRRQQRGVGGIAAGCGVDALLVSPVPPVDGVHCVVGRVRRGGSVRAGSATREGVWHRVSGPRDVPNSEVEIGEQLLPPVLAPGHHFGRAQVLEGLVVGADHEVRAVKVVTPHFERLCDGEELLVAGGVPRLGACHLL